MAIKICNNIVLPNVNGASGNNVSLGRNSGLTNISTGFNNITIGANTGSSVTSGNNNTFLGYDAGSAVTDGANNTIIGSVQGTSSLNDTVIIGAGATERIKANATGLFVNGTAVGGGGATLNAQCSLYIGGGGASASSLATDNYSIGCGALNNITTGSRNFAVGYQSTCSLTCGIDNVAIGKNSLGNTTIGFSNFSVGHGALANNTVGYYNMAVGFRSIYCSTTGCHNTAIGACTLGGDGGGSYNIALGNNSQCCNTTGSCNISMGPCTLGQNTIGVDNISLGTCSSFCSTTGSCNIAIGRTAGKNIGTGTYNISIGTLAAGIPALGAFGLLTAGSGYTPNLNTSCFVGLLCTSGVNCICGILCSNAGGCITGFTWLGGILCSGCIYCVRPSNCLGCFPTSIACFGSSAILVTGSNNIAIGTCALACVAQGPNIGIGCTSGAAITTGSNNTFIGGGASTGDCTNTVSVFTPIDCIGIIVKNTGVFYNGAGSTCFPIIGTGLTNNSYYNLFAGTKGNNTTSCYNVAIGYCSMFNNLEYLGVSGENVAIGNYALYGATCGGRNVAIGCAAGCNVTTGCNNILLGYNAQPAAGSSVNSVTLGDANIATIRAATQTISALSDIRDKKNVENIPIGLQFIREVRPVKFTWNRRDGTKPGISEAGFIAQELLQLTENYNVKEWLPIVLEDNPEKLEAAPGKLLPIMVRAIQELAEKNDELQKRIELLESK